jgi:hypothetical protein
VKRTSYKVIGADGAVAVEVQQRGQAIEVSEVDFLGRQVEPVYTVRTWKGARDMAGAIIGDAVKKGRV